jgi:hypothetical protein
MPYKDCELCDEAHLCDDGEPLLAVMAREHKGQFYCVFCNEFVSVVGLLNLCRNCWHRSTSVEELVRWAS